MSIKNNEAYDKAPYSDSLNSTEQSTKATEPVCEEDTVLYLSKVLEKFDNFENTFPFERGGVPLRPLVNLLSGAEQASNTEERCSMLHQLGDLSLFLNAMYAENYARQGISPSYLIRLGEEAYVYLAKNAKANRHIFRDLSRHFVHASSMLKYARIG